jgi:3-hydroxyisobutyrate dehydrogenase-like beta-hydroxyacid dehydrogenase
MRGLGQMGVRVALRATDRGFEGVVALLRPDRALELHLGVEPRDHLLGVIELEQAVVAIAKLLAALALARLLGWLRRRDRILLER